MYIMILYALGILILGVVQKNKQLMIIGAVGLGLVVLFYFAMFLAVYSSEM